MGEVATHLATLGIDTPADAADDPDFWRQVDALRLRAPVLSELMNALGLAVVRSGPRGRDQLAATARADLKAMWRVPKRW
jgi:hypothetical protein